MSPRKETAVMPFSENRGFETEGFGEEEGVPAAAEGVAVDVDEVF